MSPPKHLKKTRFSAGRLVWFPKLSRQINSMVLFYLYYIIMYNMLTALPAPYSSYSFRTVHFPLEAAKVNP